jgi:hypothetical protein
MVELVCQLQVLCCSVETEVSLSLSLSLSPSLMAITRKPTDCERRGVPCPRHCGLNPVGIMSTEPDVIFPATI